jgi:paraquat-inducible protein B
LIHAIVDMSKKANPTLIGLFFVVGFALTITGLLLFSSRSLFHPQVTFILYFEDSLKGLEPGAPVKFRGVTIGSVVEVLIRHNQPSNDHSMPVIIAIDKEMAQSKSDEELQFDKTRLNQLVTVGYRARLEAESLVTGVLYVALDFVPNAPPPEFHQLSHEYEEIPTLPTDVQKLLAALAHFDIAGLSDKLNSVLNRLDTSLSELNVRDINAGVTNLLTSANRMVASADLSGSLASLNRTLDQARALLKRIDDHVDSLADSATNTLGDARKTFADLRVAIQNVSGLLSTDSTIPSDLRQALQELGNAGRAVADLAEFLERNPNSLLVGKKRAKEQQ